MLRILSTALAVLAITTASLVYSARTRAALPPGITLIGKGVVSGTALDKSGLTGNICQQGAPANCVPKAIFGGFGSDITYTGHDNVFIAAPDRGPFDGLTDVPYLDRFHFLHITTDVGAPFPNICSRRVFSLMIRARRLLALPALSCRATSSPRSGSILKGFE